jgi:hypothetical protein
MLPFSAFSYKVYKCLLLGKGGSYVLKREMCALKEIWSEHGASLQSREREGVG